MTSSLVGRIAVIKDGCQFDGHWGVVIEANPDDNEYLIAGGSLSVLTESGTIEGGAPLLLREDFTVKRKLDSNQKDAVKGYQIWLQKKQSAV